MALSLAAAVLTILHVAPVQAQALLAVLVASGGADTSGCGSVISSPCKSLGWALQRAVPGGEIVFLTPDVHTGDTITQSVNIRNDGVGDVTVIADAFAGFRIQAGAGDVVSLRGLTIDGFARSDFGILLTTASAVHIQNCIITNFQDTGPTGNGGHSA